jgi:peptide/nickel transport system permease protein
LAALVTGSVLTETVFAWPGLGRLSINAVYNNDFPVLTGCVLIFTLIYVIAHLLVDIAYALLDPRIRYA